MKLIIQIPCHNEAQVITNTIKSLPTIIEGFDSIDIDRNKETGYNITVDI